MKVNSQQDLDSHLGTALGGVSTSGQWSILEGLLGKVNKRLKAAAAEQVEPVSAQELHVFVCGQDEAALELRGVWRHGFGTGTIVCVNPAFGRACATRGWRLSDECECRGGGRGSGRDGSSEDARRYFESQAYHGGRHASTQSRHLASCPCWRPAPSGHLHSWRRGYDQNKIKSNCKSKSEGSSNSNGQGEARSRAATEGQGQGQSESERPLKKRR